MIDKDTVPYGFRNMNSNLWAEAPNPGGNNADFGLTVAGPPSGYQGNTWYYLTFYEGGNTSRNWGIQLAMRREGGNEVLFRNKNGGTWGTWRSL